MADAVEEDPYDEIGFSSEVPGKPIKGYVNCMYEVGRKGTAPGEFGGWLQHFSVSKDGNTLYTSDLRNKRIQLIDLKSKKPKHAFPTIVEDFKFQARGIHILRNGNLCLNCVGFDGTSQIGIFSPEGRLIDMFGSDVIGSAYAMTVDNLDRISVMDRRKVRITTLTPEGRLLGHFDPCIQGDVLRIGCDSRGRLIIPDHLSNSVVVYEPSSGSPVVKIRPAFGTGHEFKYPAGVACDAEDNLFVCDVGNHRVSKFTPEGVFQAVILSKNNHLWRPHDVAATHQGELIISEVSGTYVKVFSFQDY